MRTRSCAWLGKGFGVADGRQRVRHVEHGGDAAERRRRRAAAEVFLVRIAGVAEMHVNVDRAGQDMQPGRIQRFARRRHRLRRADGVDLAVLDRDAGAIASASGETIVPPLMTRSTFSDIVMHLPSQHRPAAVDRQVDAGDLARYVAGEKKTGIGDVVIDGDALERVVGGVALGGLLLRDAELLRHVAADFFAETRAVDHAGRNAVDVDVVLADFERKTLGDAAQAPFGGRIGHAPGAPAHAEGAADIDDLAVALRRSWSAAPRAWCGSSHSC